MNYHELKYILCIAKYQNLTKAAQELYISQPTLTKHLQKLEREMGTKLFTWAWGWRATTNRPEVPRSRR